MEIGWVYFHARRWDQAIGQFQKTLDLDAKSPLPLVGLGQVYTTLGRYGEALAALDKAEALSGDFLWLKGVRGWTLGLAGRTDEARQVLRQLQEAATERKVDPFAFAYVYHGLGDRDQTLAWLRKAYEERSAEMMYLRSPIWDDLRTDQRFVELVHNVGLATDEKGS